MRRRLTAIVLTIAYLASQLAVVPHVHAVNEQRSDHQARPHIHVSWFDHGDHTHGGEHTQGHRHSHDHEHGHIHDHGHALEHAHADDRHEPSHMHLTESTDLPSPHSHESQSTSEEAPNPHDGDAVYLPHDAGAPSTISASVHPTDGLMIAWSVVVDVGSPRSAASGHAVGANLGHKCSSGCPLYLTLRALRL